MAALFLLVPVFMLTMGVMAIRLIDQIDKDKDRRTYKIVFPRSVTVEDVEGWLTSVSGAINEPWFGLLGTYSMTFEVEATSQGYEHRIMIPWQRADEVVATLRSSMPGIAVSRSRRVTRDWTRSVEIRETDRDHTLAIDDPKRLSNMLLAAMQPLDEGEAMLLQWVFVASAPRSKPLEGENKDKLADQREKLSQRGLKGIMRLAALSGTGGKARALVGRWLHLLAGTATPHNRLKTQWGLQAELRRRVNGASLPLIMPMSVTLTEFIGLSGIPLEGPSLPTMSFQNHRAITPKPSIATEGRVLGMSDASASSDRPIAVPWANTTRHTWIIGGSGAMKSWTLCDYVMQDMAAGHGVILIESSGDLYSRVLDRVPHNRRDDVIAFDLTDTEWPVGFNLMQQGNTEHIVDQLTAIISAADGTSLYNENVLPRALKTLAIDPSLTVADIIPLLSPVATQRDWHEQLKARVEDVELKGWWQDYDNMGILKAQQYVQPTVNRVRRLTARQAIINVVGQRQSSFRIDDVIRNRQILLINLFGLPATTAEVFGKLLTDAVWQSARRQMGSGPTQLYLDEFHRFVSMGDETETMFSEARKFNLGLNVAHQYMKQLTPSLTSSVMANANTKISMMVGHEDARTIATQFGSAVEPDQLANLKQGSAVVKLAGTDGGMNVVTINTPPVSKPTGSARYIVARSRHLYGRSRHDVERDLQMRYYVDKPAKRRPPKGRVGWSD